MESCLKAENITAETVVLVSRGQEPLSASPWYPPSRFHNVGLQRIPGIPKSHFSTSVWLTHSSPVLGEPLSWMVLWLIFFVCLFVFAWGWHVTWMWLDLFWSAGGIYRTGDGCFWDREFCSILRLCERCQLSGVFKWCHAVRVLDSPEPINMGVTSLKHPPPHLQRYIHHKGLLSLENPERKTAVLRIYLLPTLSVASSIPTGRFVV